MQKTNIDWPWNPLYTWNPITGCKAGCDYCYAKKIHDRFNKTPFTDVVIHQDRLNDKFPKKPSFIFVGSMTDICWWDNEGKKAVLNIVKRNPQHTFIFLTKNPGHAYNMVFPDNCILGVTVTGNDWGVELDRINSLYMMSHKRKFVSIEPLLGKDFEGFLLNEFDTVIVGAMTGRGAIKPKQSWIDEIKRRVPAGHLYWKNSIKEVAQ